jgi:hypothetical protein
MVTLKCTVCGKEHEAHYANKLYCSKACKQKAWRAARAARLEAAAPARAELVGKLERFAPQTAALARELIGTAGDDCTELIVRLIGQAVREVGPAMPGAPVARAGAPTKRSEVVEVG